MATVTEEWGRLCAQLSLKVPATESQIEQCQRGTGVSLPQEYKEFLRRTNGAEGTVGKDAYVILWPVDDLCRLNDAYQVSEYAPDFLLFGSDGGGEAFAFDLASPSLPIVSIPFVGMTRELAKPAGSNFWQFMEKLWRS